MRTKDGFAGVPIPSSLYRDRRGRAVLPPVDALNDNRGLYWFSEADLDATLQEVRRRQRWWWVGSGVRGMGLGFIGYLLLVWPG